MAITDWPAQERPREKLLNQGAEALTDAELLAVLLRTGKPGCSALDLARNLLSYYRGLRPLLSASQQSLCSHGGIGEAAFAQFQAVRELAVRHAKAELEKRPQLTSAYQVRHYLLSKLRDLPHEVFQVLYLDNQNCLIKDEVLFRGTVNASAVYPREVVVRALAEGATGVIFAHNHPSGIAEPSASDIAITEQLKQALKLVDVRVLDHQIVANNQVVSLAERGLV